MLQWVWVEGGSWRWRELSWKCITHEPKLWHFCPSRVTAWPGRFLCRYPQVHWSPMWSFQFTWVPEVSSLSTNLLRFTCTACSSPCIRLKYHGPESSKSCWIFSLITLTVSRESQFYGGNCRKSLAKMTADRLGFSDTGAPSCATWLALLVDRLFPHVALSLPLPHFRLPRGPSALISMAAEGILVCVSSPRQQKVPLSVLWLPYPAFYSSLPNRHVSVMPKVNTGQRDGGGQGDRWGRRGAGFCFCPMPPLCP